MDADPDALSIPVLHLSPADVLDIGLRESNDYDDDPPAPLPSTTTPTQQHHHYHQHPPPPQIQLNQLVPEITADVSSTSSPPMSCSPPSIASHDHHLNSLNRPAIIYRHRPSISHIDDDDDDDELQIIEVPASPMTPRSPFNESNFVKKGSVRHHRSTPNLIDNTDLPIPSNTDLIIQQHQHHDNSPLIIADLNDIQTLPAAGGNLNKNFPSNLELSTNSEHLYDSLGLLNNQVICPVLGAGLIIKPQPQTPMVMNSNNSQQIKLINNNHQSSSFVGSVMMAAAMGVNTTSAGTGAPVSAAQLAKRIINQRYKLIGEGDVHVCKLPHSQNVFSKILNSKLLRRWKGHRLVLNETEIFSTTVIYDFLDY